MPENVVSGLPTPLTFAGDRFKTEREVAEASLASAMQGINHIFRFEMAKLNNFGNYQYWVMPNPAAQKEGRVVEPFFVCCNLDDVTRLLKTHPSKTPGYETTLLGLGVLSQSNMEQWAWQREHLKHAFAIKSLAKLIPLFIQGTKTLCDEIDKAHREEGADAVIDLQESVSNMTFLMIGHSALGETDDFLEKNSAALRAAFDTAFSSIGVVNDSVREAEKTMHEFGRRVFQRAESKPFAPDSLISLLTGTDPKTGLLYYPEAIRFDELMTFMFAGHETTAWTICWIMYELAKHPQVQDKVIKEIDEVLAGMQKNNEELAYNNLLRFRYLAKVINEAMRLHPVVANGTFRQLTADDILHDQTGKPCPVPKGVTVVFSHYIIHRNPHLWGPDADEFKPDRKWNDKAFMPFTKPSRDCIGRNLAIAEIRVVMVILLSRFRFVKAWQDGDDDENDEGFNRATLRPMHGPRLKFISRANEKK